MKANHLLIILTLYAILLPGCRSTQTPVVRTPQATTPAGDPSVLMDCKRQPQGSDAKVAAACGKLVSLLDEQVGKQNIPGLVMAERLADGTVIWGTSGHLGPSGNENWSADTPSLIASVTKTFTAVVVMQLVEEGKLSLDDTVDTWFPEQPDGDKITVRMLLSHTSGLANFSRIFGSDEDKWTRKWSPEDLIAEANKAGPVGMPGSHAAHYSNTNYIMLGRIIEKVTGNSWEDEVQSRIIQPLGLKNNTFLKEGDWKERMVPGYISYGKI